MADLKEIKRVHKITPKTLPIPTKMPPVPEPAPDPRPLTPA
jgi:hypothetical protein